MVDQSGMGDQRGTLLESPVQQLRRIGDCYSRIAAAGPCPQWHWCGRCCGAVVAVAVAIARGSRPALLQGSPVKRLPLLVAHLADPWREMATPLGIRRWRLMLAVVCFGLFIGMCTKMHKQKYAFQIAGLPKFVFWNAQYG